MLLGGHKCTTGGHSHNGKLCTSPWQLQVHADKIIHASVIGEPVHFHWALAWPVRSSGVLNPKLSDVRGGRRQGRGGRGEREETGGEGQRRGGPTPGARPRTRARQEKPTPAGAGDDRREGSASNRSKHSDSAGQANKDRQGPDKGGNEDHEDDEARAEGRGREGERANAGG